MMKLILIEQPQELDRAQPGSGEIVMLGSQTELADLVEVDDIRDQNYRAFLPDGTIVPLRVQVEKRERRFGPFSWTVNREIVVIDDFSRALRDPEYLADALRHRLVTFFALPQDDAESMSLQALLEFADEAFGTRG